MVDALSLLMAVRELQPFLAPEPLDLLVVSGPSFGAEKLRDLAIAVAAILLGEPVYKKRLPLMART